MVKGFLKSACGALRKVSSTKSSKVKAYKKEIDQLFFVFPDESNKTRRGIRIYDYGETYMMERSLRASTSKGERVALARSEVVPAGSWIKFDIVLLRDEDEDWLIEMLDYSFMIQEDIRTRVYDALADIAFDYSDLDEATLEQNLDVAVTWFMERFFEFDYHEQD